MSKLYIKQKLISWGDAFEVKNEYEEDLYTVKGEVFSLGKKLHVFDMTGNEVALIRSKVWSWLPHFFVEVEGNPVAEIVGEFSFLKQRYHIEGCDWKIEGDCWGHNYQITQNGSPVVSIRKAWFTWGDSYELDIVEGQSELMALAVVLAIDVVAARQAAAAASSTGN